MPTYVYIYDQNQPVHQITLDGSLTLLKPQSRFGDKPLKIQVVRPQSGTAALKGIKDLCCVNLTTKRSVHTYAQSGLYTPPKKEIEKNKGFRTHVRKYLKLLYLLKLKNISFEINDFVRIAYHLFGKNSWHALLCTRRIDLSLILTLSKSEEPYPRTLSQSDHISSIWYHVSSTGFRRKSSLQATSMCNASIARTTGFILPHAEHTYTYYIFIHEENNVYIVI